MAKSLYDALCNTYELMLGPLPWREELIQTLRETVSEDVRQLYFNPQLLNPISHPKLAGKARMPADQLPATIERLATEGMTLVHADPGTTTYDWGPVHKSAMPRARSARSATAAPLLGPAHRVESGHDQRRFPLALSGRVLGRSLRTLPGLAARPWWAPCCSG